MIRNGKQFYTKEGKLINFNVCQSVKSNCRNSTHESLVIDKEDCKKYSDKAEIDKIWELKCNKDKKLSFSFYFKQ